MLSFRYPDKPYRTTREVVESLNFAQWQASKKYDGWHIGIYTDENKKAVLFSSTGRLLEEVPSYIVEELNQVAPFLLPLSVLDAEFVGPRGHHKPRIFLFDCLAWDGEWLTQVPFESRWDTLVSIMPFLSFCPHFHIAETAENPLQLFDELKEEWYSKGCQRDFREHSNWI